MQIYDANFNDYCNSKNHETAINYLRGMVWSEVETTEQPKPTHSEHIETFEGVACFYDYGADYYFYVDVS